MLEGSVTKLFPPKFSLSKECNHPIALGISRRLQKLTLRLIKHDRRDEEGNNKHTEFSCFRKIFQYQKEGFKTVTAVD
jgi:hypothetical protein